MLATVAALLGLLQRWLSKDTGWARAWTVLHLTLPALVSVWLAILGYYWVAAGVVVTVATVEIHRRRAEKLASNPDRDALVSPKVTLRSLILLEAAGILYVAATVVGHEEARGTRWPALASAPDVLLLRRYR